jgi:hypothetical protein
MFQISSNEWKNLKYQKYQIGTSSSGHGGHRRRPYAIHDPPLTLQPPKPRIGFRPERFNPSNSAILYPLTSKL